MVFYHKNQLLPEIALVTTQALREYLEHVWKQYKTADRVLKSKMLDEIVRNTGMHRKAAIRLMNKKYPPRILQGFKGGRKKSYSPESKQHLARVWKMMAYMCPERMKVALVEWLKFNEHKECTLTIKQELLRMSISSIRRFLSDERAKLRRKINTGTRRGLKKFIAKVPIRNLGEQPQEPGHCEIDCVAHCGGSLSGQFAWTLTLTDIATGWTECEAVWAKDSAEISKSMFFLLLAWPKHEFYQR